MLQLKNCISQHLFGEKESTKSIKTNMGSITTFVYLIVFLDKNEDLDIRFSERCGDFLNVCEMFSKNFPK